MLERNNKISKYDIILKIFHHIMKWNFSFLFYFKHLFQLHSEMKLIILVLFSAPVSVRVLSPTSDQEPSISSKTLSSLFCSSVENSSLFSMVMREVGMEEENNSDDPSLWEDALLRLCSLQKGYKEIKIQ